MFLGLQYLCFTPSSFLEIYEVFKKLVVYLITHSHIYQYSIIQILYTVCMYIMNGLIFIFYMFGRINRLVFMAFKWSL